MERLRIQKSQAARVPSPSKVTTIIDRSSDDGLSSSDRPGRGSRYSVKQKFEKSGSDSGSCGKCRTTLEDQLAYESGRSSPLPQTGNLMKNLLSDEMSKGTDSRRRAPSIIAKLMGLDRMPPQHSVNKQPKSPSNALHGKTASTGACRHRKSCDNQACRKIATDKQLFKDVYEVRESLKGQNKDYASQAPHNRKHTEDEMAFIRQKFMDAKRLSTDEKLQGSKEFRETIDVLSSNNHLFLKFLQEPDSLFANRLHDSTQSHHGKHNVRASNVLDYNINVIGYHSSREASQKIDISLSRDWQEGQHGHIRRRHPQDSDSPVIYPAEGRKATSGVPAKIVLLKPNQGRTRKTAKSFSPSSSCEPLSDVEMHGANEMHPRHREVELRVQRRLPIELEFSAHKSRESRRVAKEVAQEMISRSGSASFNVPCSGYRGYSADESSHDTSGNDSPSESDAIVLSPEIPHSSSFRGRSSSSSSYAESSINREGKKRLSERWKMAHSSDGARAYKGPTLGEMLATPDYDFRSPSIDGSIADEGSSGRYDSTLQLHGPVEPLGISSKDGWKDGCVKSLSRSRSLPNGYHRGEKSESHTKHELSLGHKAASSRGRKKAVTRDAKRKEDSSSGSRRLDDDKKPDSPQNISTKVGNDMHEIQIGGIGKKIALAGKDSPEHKNVILEAPISRLDTILDLDSITEMEHEKIPTSLYPADDLLAEAELSSDVQVHDDSNCGDLPESAPQEAPGTWSNEGLPCLQNPVAQPESPTSSKEAEQPSPVSVLEAHFSEDHSAGSECFERVSADLHGLRMQLQLLKLESKAAGGGETPQLSSDEDERPSHAQPTTTSWQSSYITDVLTELNLDDTNPDSISSWGASECPMGPWIFDTLEKKYNEDHDTNSSKHDRKLLFDRIKHATTEIAQRSVSLNPWVESRIDIGNGVKWTRARFEEEIRKVLAAEAGREEVVALSDRRWADLGAHVDGVGREIGKMVLDELIAESFAVEE